MLLPALSGDNGFHLLGQLAVLGAALSYAFAGVCGWRFRGLGVTPMMTATGQVTVSSLPLPFALLLEQPLQLAPPGASVWLSILGLAVVCTAFAYILYFRILASAGANNLALVTLLVPVTAILLGTLFLGEQLSLSHALGMLLIASGLFVIDDRLWQRLTRKAAPL